MRRLAAAWIPLIGWCGLIYWFSDQPYLDLYHLAPDYPSVHWYDYPLRKLGHLTEYAILFLLARRAMPDGWAWAFSVLYGAGDEWHQTFVAGRTGRLVDVAINAVGASLPPAWARVKILLRRR